MRKLFQKWLFVFVIAAFLLTFGASWIIHNALAKSAAQAFLRVKLETAKHQVERTADNLETVIALSDASALIKARALCAFVDDDPTLLQSHERLEAMRVLLDVDELHISDAKGILIASIPKKYEGYNMADDEQSQAFLPALTQPDFALVQEPRPNGHGVSTQYAGVARRDMPGIVQIGYRPTRRERAEQIADIDRIANEFQIGQAGKLRILPNTDGVTTASFYHDTVDGVPSLCYAVPHEDLLLVGNFPESEMYLSRNEVLRILVIANILLFTVIFFLISWLLQHVVIKGIYSVNSSLSEITNGNLDEEVNVHTTAEFRDLSFGINQTVAALKHSIENEAQRINAELEMGRTIQSSVLPMDFPVTERYSIRAKMYTAKEVGGDFYDFFKLDDHRLAMIVADVSGKGITAALYMMNAKALLKELLLSCTDPADAFLRANAELCANNQAHMFLTAFLAILDVRTGELTCVNAGHNPPAWKHNGQKWDFLRIKHGVALGVSKKAKYTAIPVQLLPADRLLLYTDGVTEAMSPDHEQFGEGRLLELLNHLPTTDEERLTVIRHELDAFADGTPQSDDITLLSLDYLGPTREV